MAPKKSAAKIVAELRGSGADTASIRAELAKRGFTKSRISQVCPLRTEGAAAMAPVNPMAGVSKPDTDDEDMMPALQPAADAPDDMWVCKQCGNVEMTHQCRRCWTPRHAIFAWSSDKEDKDGDTEQAESSEDDGESLGLLPSVGRAPLWCQEN